MYEVIPNMYAIKNSYRLPPIIKREINNQLTRPCTYFDYGFLEEGSAAYFCFDNSLYVWSFQNCETLRQQSDMAPLKLEFNQMVTAVAMVVPLPSMDIK
jgi:hypothetical protein